MTLEFLTGQAGTGKTTELKNRIARFKAKHSRRDYAILTATTGIAAINLSGGTGDTVSTINSRLGFFDSEDLVHKLQASIKSSGSSGLVATLKHLSKQAENISIDEVSMMDKIQLEALHEGIMRANDDPAVFNRGGLGLVLVGDFLQLPPIKARYAFEAKCWKDFKITKLKKIWRQSDLAFLEMMNAARRGDGQHIAKALYEIEGIKVANYVDANFDGTTLVPVNALVDKINEERLKQLVQMDSKANALFEFETKRWGKQRSEWKVVPELIRVCKNGYVMILANDAPDFTYANGSCGHIVDANVDSGTVFVKLKDGGRQVRVRRVVRKYTQRETPEGCREPKEYMSYDDFVKEWKYGRPTQANQANQPAQRTTSESSNLLPDMVGGDNHNLRSEGNICNNSEVDGMERGEKKEEKGGDSTDSEGTESIDTLYKAYLMNLTRENRSTTLNGTPINAPYFDYLDEKWVIGEINYVPVRLAYASSVHKSQGLSLDCVQIDFTHEFFGAPSMAYVALSRVRTPQGLTVIGNRKVFEDRTNISSEVLQWI